MLSGTLMEVKFDGFDWDQGNVRKLEKHGIPPGLVEEVFRGEALMSPDLLHSNREKKVCGYRTFSFAAYAVRGVHDPGARWLSASEAY
jgi:uncharacterized DUF497 family protein